jgi:hypothetical protein
MSGNTQITVKALENPVILGEEPSILSLIQQPSVAMSIWRRQHLSRVQTLSLSLANLPQPLKPNARFVSHWTEAADTVDYCYQTQDLSAAIRATLHDLANDIKHLSEIFHTVTGSIYVETRLNYIRHDACLYWHQDNVSYRMICTYHGHGTQWITPAWSGDALAARDRWDGPFNSLSEGDVSIFKGTSQDDHHDAIVHRSPPIKAKGLGRLVLCINTSQAMDLAKNQPYKKIL